MKPASFPLSLFFFFPSLLHKPLPQPEPHTCTLQLALSQVPEMLLPHLALHCCWPTGEGSPLDVGAHWRGLLCAGTARVTDPGTSRCAGPCLHPSSGGQSWALAANITTSVHLTAVNGAETTKGNHPATRDTNYWVCTPEALKFLSRSPRCGFFGGTASLGLGTGLQR